MYYNMCISFIGAKVRIFCFVAKKNAENCTIDAVLCTNVIVCAILFYSSLSRKRRYTFI